MCTSLKKISISPKQRKILNDLIRLGRIELKRVPKDFREAVEKAKKINPKTSNTKDVIIYSKIHDRVFFDDITYNTLLQYCTILWDCYVYHIASDTYLSKSIYTLLFADINEAMDYRKRAKDNIKLKRRSKS